MQTFVVSFLLNTEFEVSFSDFDFAINKSFLFGYRFDLGD